MGRPHSHFDQPGGEQLQWHRLALLTDQGPVAPLLGLHVGQRALTQLLEGGSSAVLEGRGAAGPPSCPLVLSPQGLNKGVESTEAVLTEEQAGGRGAAPCWWGSRAHTLAGSFPPHTEPAAPCAGQDCRSTESEAGGQDAGLRHLVVRAGRVASIWQTR